ncbi:MULE domain-containing protein [Trichonephila clavata]|uniref:MULE domain-containing protein n=1 Tax=Trichonephila clavata TaxID=2740835 RepID=A0A8X6GX29_TRICU|nr:MULE domain-containing protein [Trichonephila clavata]
MNYQCCRSGTYKPKWKGVKSLKSQGSAKIGISCPAIIKVRQSTENVVVQYFPNHKNHENQLEHLRLSESDRAAVAGRLKDGVSEKKLCRILEKKLLLTVAERCLLKKRISIILKGTSILMVILKGMKLMHAIKNAVGIIETTTFMTDDAPAFYNAWSYVMGTVKNGTLQETGTKI